MLRNWAAKISFVIFIVINLPACADSNEEMFVLATSAQRVASAIESAVRYKNAPVSLNEQDLLTFAVKHDPGLLTAFSDYRIHIKRDRKNTVLLICDSEDKHGLWEDAGCTPRFENHLWQRDPLPPCRPTLDPAKICTR